MLLFQVSNARSLSIGSHQLASAARDIQLSVFPRLCKLAGVSKCWHSATAFHDLWTEVDLVRSGIPGAKMWLAASKYQYDVVNDQYRNQVV